jgi:hypothetical protein
LTQVNANGRCATDIPGVQCADATASARAFKRGGLPMLDYTLTFSTMIPTAIVIATAAVFVYLAATTMFRH